MGTLEPTWLTPTSHDTILIGRSLHGLVVFARRARSSSSRSASRSSTFTSAPNILFAIPAMLVAVFAMLGVAFLLAGIVLVIREANFFIDCTNFLFGVASGVSFPITFLPGLVQPLALLLPTTYAMDLLRQHAIGARPLFDPTLEYVGLIVDDAAHVPARTLGVRAGGAVDARPRHARTVLARPG